MHQSGQTTPVTWDGFYMESGQPVPMFIQDMRMTSEGEIYGEGSNSSGYYTIKGKILPEGSFNFRLVSQTGGATKMFTGNLKQGGILTGMFDSVGYASTAFELRTKLDVWSGTFKQNGETKVMKLNMSASRSIFGIAKGPDGVCIINGSVDTNTYAVNFTKAYPGMYKIDYHGKMINNGTFWVINGKWQILDSDDSGEFEIYKEAPDH
jgi:hypothetical protein